ncbi:hypothetical protein HanRHA438_Chr17g0835771 [Helianthus annuus]|nr:hypothetical protein HanRHA438_Chr17g0835771 [Helianthus annuus]
MAVHRLNIDSKIKIDYILKRKFNLLHIIYNLVHDIIAFDCFVC